MVSNLSPRVFEHRFGGTVVEYGDFNPRALFPLSSTTQSDTVMALANAGSGNGTLEDVRAFFTNVTDTMTTHMRMHGARYQSEPVRGAVVYNTVCIHVRWEWIAYSVAVVALTLLFFVWVVIQAKIDQSRLYKRWVGRGGDQPQPFHDFKSSALTLLFHGLDKESLDSMVDVGSSNREKELNNLSKQSEVQLKPTEQGWKLSTKGK